jgi:hypothetical protein
MRCSTGSFDGHDTLLPDNLIQAGLDWAWWDDSRQRLAAQPLIHKH